MIESRARPRHGSGQPAWRINLPTGSSPSKKRPDWSLLIHWRPKFQVPARNSTATTSFVTGLASSASTARRIEAE